MNRAIATSAIVFGLLLAANVQAGPANKDQLYNGQSANGRAVTQPQNGRVVDVSAQKALNVNCGETVTFRKGAQTFSWKFDTVGHRSMDLRAIAPAGFTDVPLMIYVSQSEAERS